MTCLKGKNSWEKICKEIQERSLNQTLLEIESAEKLRKQIFKCLNDASNEKILSTNLSELHQLLKISNGKQGYYEITGGGKDSKRNFKRNPDIPHFKLNNGRWFDFAITIDETIRPAQIIGFDFEIRFPKREGEIVASFLRIDLNLPDHRNDERDLRFHLHPNNGDIMIHSPPMSPLEILHMFLYGMNIREKPRT
ncbi:hypothetical protein [Pseudanabaena sp. UWO310]|uniref:hypothetical protein n=2 Tax=Pseudanabaenaceae TaxID=1890436 RepID=UPI001CC1D4CB|nr:hypothetical protein [Pseudanabaena sp. UWO310]